MNYHQPVLLKESIGGLNIRPDGIYIDLTFGGGGHSKEILHRLDTGRLIAFDQDADAEKNVIEDDKFLFIRANFRFVSNWLKFHGITRIDGALADLGVSSWHLDMPERGFSFRFNSVLDMRMNPDAELTAREVLNNYSEERLVKVFREYGEIGNAVKLSKLVIQAREENSVERVDDLLRGIDECLPNHYQQKYLSKVFQALRIEVNDEINALSEMLNQVTGLLKKGARFCVITYHSLEDRIVKNIFRTGNVEGVLHKDFYGHPHVVYHQVNRNVIVAGDDELQQNPRARSAKLRIAEKL
jgi:16S rRNA (cytosine1402-N4)-methyltransferase